VRLSTIGAGVIGFTAFAAGAPVQPGEPDDAARARLVAERSHLVPGEEAWIGVSFELRPKWHLYWNGRNETGGPPEVKLQLPEGFTAGEILWPAPHRLVQPGDILDHVYEDRVTLMVPVRVPAEARAGSTARITAELSWMVCKDVCMLGEASDDISLPIGTRAQARPSADARLFEEARSRIPKAPPKENSPFTLEWKDGAAVITAPGAQKVSFYPGPEAGGFESFLRDGEAKGERLVIKINPFLDGPVRLAGVLEITRPKPAPPTIFALRAENIGVPATTGNPGG
jgi:thiol:disulfide interchange protein DsbD